MWPWNKALPLFQKRSRMDFHLSAQTTFWLCLLKVAMFSNFKWVFLEDSNLRFVGLKRAMPLAWRIQVLLIFKHIHCVINSFLFQAQCILNLMSGMRPNILYDLWCTQIIITKPWCLEARLIYSVIAQRYWRINVFSMTRYDKQVGTNEIL